ncbi:nitroreductase [Marinobacteraceae bacterium S3BR75-40.1]
MSSVIESILTRQSEPRLEAPAPDRETLREVLACAFKAPDHALLRPWRYLVIEGEGLERMGKFWAECLQEENPECSEADRRKALGQPLRAPMIIVGITSPKAHPKVPPIEQHISTGVGLGYMLLALEERGFAGIWRTGDMAYHQGFKKRLGLQEEEQIAGFLYVGTPTLRKQPSPEPEFEGHVSFWQG